MSKKEVIKELGLALSMMNANYKNKHIRSALELLESEPEPTEFTKELRSLLKEYMNEFLDKPIVKEHTQATIIVKAGEACDIIDRLTAENKELRLLVNANKAANRMYAETEKRWEYDKKQLRAELKAKNEKIESLKNDLTIISACHGHDGLCNKCKARIQQALKGIK